MRTSQGPVIHLKNYREPEYWVRDVVLDINLHPAETRVKSTILVERNKTTKAGTPFRLDGDELVLVSLKVNGRVVKPDGYKDTADSLTIRAVPKGKKFTVEIETMLNPTANTKLMGLYRSGGTYCTQCEAEGFRRITYFVDRPDVLAVYTTRIEADRKEAPVLLGNGNPVKKGSAGKGRHFAIWHDPHPKPSYLFALVGGSLGSIHKNYKTASGKKVKLGIYVEKGKEPSASYAMDALVRSMRWDEQVFGCEYDLDVFNIVAISDFNMGAMENKGLNIFNDKYVLADPDTATDTDFAHIEAIIAHEYFHNWTGNRITCRDWFQLCLKEGLTVYRDQEFTSDHRSRPVKRISDVRMLKSHQFPEDAGPLAHPVRPETYREINNFYTATVYEKGAEIVRMLATILGEKQFRKGMNLYLKKHDGDAATIEQFVTCFERAARKDLSQFFLWYSQAGTPHVQIGSSYDKANKRLVLETEQVTPATPGQRRKAPMHVPIAMALFGGRGEEITPKSVSGADHAGGLLQLKKRKHRIVVEGVGQRPVVSFNRGFTAPIKVDYRQSLSDLAFLAEHDTDPYCRWQAFQTYASRHLVSSVKALQSGKRPDRDERLTDISVKIARMEALEPAFRALILTLPGEGELAQMLGRNVDPAAILKARTGLARELGKALEPYRSEIKRTLSTPGEYSPDAGNAGKRSLRNLLLQLGLIGGSKSAREEIQRLYYRSDNMTDRYAALLGIVHFHPDKNTREKALESFYAKYNDNHLVLDKWFAVQASRPGTQTVATVRKLLKHPGFNLSNPNRLRSLIGVFASANPGAFNAANGTGYRLVAAIVAKLDQTNPQVAARLLTAFRSFRSLEPGRRRQAEDALRAIQAKGGLSRDVSDILERTLG